MAEIDRALGECSCGRERPLGECSCGRVKASATVDLWVNVPGTEMTSATIDFRVNVPGTKIRHLLQ